MADNLLVRALKRIGNAIIDVSLKAIIMSVGLTILGVIGVICLALRGNPHGPWFYAAAGALASFVVMLLVMVVLVALRLSRSAGTTTTDSTCKQTEAIQEFKDEHRRYEETVKEKQIVDDALVQKSAELLAAQKKIEAWGWLHQIAEIEKEAIAKTVTISSGGMLRKGFDGSAPYINFNFWLHNCSVFPVSLDSVDGFIKCVTVPIGKRLEVVDDQRSTIVSNECPHGSTRSLVIRVWLLQDDLKIIEGHSDLYFKFDELNIKVKGGKQWPDITSKKVAIDWVMDINGNAKPWRS